MFISYVAEYSDVVGASNLEAVEVLGFVSVILHGRVQC